MNYLLRVSETRFEEESPQFSLASNQSTVCREIVHPMGIIFRDKWGRAKNFAINGLGCNIPRQMGSGAIFRNKFGRA